VTAASKKKQACLVVCVLVCFARCTPIKAHLGPNHEIRPDFLGPPAECSRGHYRCPQVITTWVTLFSDGPSKTLRHQHETVRSPQTFTHNTASLSQMQVVLANCNINFVS
jgi:hypothetical protein